MRGFRAAFVVLSTALVLVSCDTPAPMTAPSRVQPSLIGGLVPDLVACTPLPYDSAAQVIGPSGGTIRVGPHALTVPEGALDSDVAISAAIVDGNVNAVRFGPEGLQFNKKASLTLSYANCGLVFGLLPHHIAYTDDLLNILDTVTADASLLSGSVTGKIRHFSDYAVAW